MLQAKVDRLEKQLEQQQDRLSDCNKDLTKQHAEQLQALHLELENQLALQVRSLYCMQALVRQAVLQLIYSSTRFLSHDLLHDLLHVASCPTVVTRLYNLQLCESTESAGKL